MYVMTNCLSGSVFLSSFKKDFFSHLDQIMCLFKATPVSGLGTNYKNLLEQKYTRENYATQHKTVMFWRNHTKTCLNKTIQENTKTCASGESNPGQYRGRVL